MQHKLSAKKIFAISETYQPRHLEMKLSVVAAFVVGVLLIFNVFPSPTEALPADVQTWGVGEVIIWLQDEGFGEDVIQVFHRNDIDGRKLLLLSVEDMLELKV